jgi:hypothetical protein
MALDTHFDYETPTTRTPNSQTHDRRCAECKHGWEAHEYAEGEWHVPSFSVLGRFHAVTLNVNGIALPRCTCTHGVSKPLDKPLHCRHYVIARGKHLARYGELVPVDPREPRSQEVRVVDGNGVELFDNDEPNTWQEGQTKKRVECGLSRLFDSVFPA